MADTYNPLEGQRSGLSLDLTDGTEERVSIIIVHKDKPNYLNILLQSICVTSQNNNYEIIVVDNGSGKETQDFLDDIEGEDEVKIIRNDKNLYWSAAANKGVAAANKDSKYFIFLHPDVVILNPGWIDLLANVADSQQSGMVGVALNSYYMEGQQVQYIEEFCLLVTRDAWDDIGPFPESLPQIGHSFIMTIKAQNKGWKPQVMKNSICHHYKIFSLKLNEYERLIERAMAELPKLLRDAQQISTPV